MLTNYELGLKDEFRLNEMQEQVIPFIEDTCNLLIASPTSSGKSVPIRMLGNPVLAKGKKIVYVGPMKALVEEKKNGWQKPGQSWEKRKVAIVTGDYAKNNSSAEALAVADIIVITPESLASALRHHDSSKNKWLHEVGLLVIDEIHGIGEKGRGGNLEAMLIEFTTFIKGVRILGLSATMPNYQEIADWISELTSNETKVVYSTYRPTRLDHRKVLHSPGPPKSVEAVKVNMIANIVLENPKDTFLIWVTKKSFGNLIYKKLAEENVASDFHHGSLSMQARKRIETLYANGHIRALVCTKTLIVGVDLDTDSAIITDQYGGGVEIPASEIQQAAGRAGRHRDGTVYYLLANDAKLNYHLKRVVEGEPVMSTLVDRAVLSTHILGAIYTGVITSPETFDVWYSRTFAAFQQRLSAESQLSLQDAITRDLKMMGMIRVNEETEEMSITYRGKIVAQLLMDPYHAGGLCKNFTKYFSLTSRSDIDIAKAIAECAPFYSTFITRDELAVIPTTIRKAVPENYWKAATVVLKRLRKEDMPPPLIQMNNDMYLDLSRVKECVNRFCFESEKWTNDDTVNQIFTRVARGISWEQAKFVLEKFTKTEQTSLHRLGLYTVDDVRKNVQLAQTVLNNKRLVELGVYN